MAVTQYKNEQGSKFSIGYGIPTHSGVTGDEYKDLATADKYIYKNNSWLLLLSGGSSGFVTSVGITMPAAFTVANSPITSTGNLAVTGAGNTAQYVRGDGTLATFPLALPTSNVKHTVKYGEALTIGQAVYVSGADGTNMVVSKASNASEATSSKTMGLVTSTGATNYIGEVITEGLLAGVDTSTATEGDTVWLGTSGNLIFWNYGGSTIKPVAPAHLVFIGIVTRVNANNGEIFVRVQNGFEIDELHDVSVVGRANNTLLGYNSSTSLHEFKTVATWLGYTPVTSGAGAGSGTTNYISKFTTNGTTIGDSQIQDNGSNIGIGDTPFSPAKVYIYGIGFANALFAAAGSNGNVGVRGSSQTDGLNGNIGVVGEAYNQQGPSVGVSGYATGSNLTGATVIGGSFTATGSTSGSNYALELVDGTQTVAGRFLKNMTTDGKANWATLVEADISNFGVYAKVGTYNNGYIPRWNAVTNTLVSGTIQDNGVNVSINSSPVIGIKLNVSSDSGVGIGVTQTAQGTGMDSRSQIAGSLANYGLIAVASRSTTQNVAIEANATLGTTSTNIGIRTLVSGGSTNYSVQLQDGTHTIAGRFLKNMDTFGSANWVNITTADVQGAVGSTTGTNNYIAKFTPDGTTIGNSLIQDNGTAVGIDTTPGPNSKLTVLSSNRIYAIVGQSNINNGVGVYGQALTGTGTLCGVVGLANSLTGTINIGLYGKAINAVSNYPIQLEEATSSTGKFLKSITSDGKANWANITAADITGVEPTITAGTTSQYWRGDKTWQTLNTTAVAEGTNLYFTETRTIASILTGLSITGGNITSSDSVLVAFGKLQNQLSAVASPMIYQGTWNASTNSPTLTSSTGTKGHVYRVTTSGSTNIDGITDWKSGDFIVYNGTTWDKWDSTDAVTSVNGYTGVVTLVKADVGLSNVENTALSTWAGSTNITTLGTIGSGIWQGTAIADTYISSASTWNAKVGGSGTLNYLSKFTASGTIGNSAVFESSGNVLIGSIVNSGFTLDVNTTSGTSSSVRVKGGSTGSGYFGSFNGSNTTLYALGDTASLLGGASDTSATLYTNTGVDMNFYIGGAHRMKILSTGNVGIGNTDPNYKLDVTGEIAIRGGEGVDDARMYFLAGDNSIRFRMETDLDTDPQNDILGFRSFNTDNILVLKGNGNVGIGTTSPNAKLEVNGNFLFGPTSGTTYFRSWDYGTDLDVSALNGPGWARAHRITTSDVSGSVFSGVYGGSTTLVRAYWTIGTPGSTETGYEFTTGIHLLKNGNVGIGTLTPNAKLDVSGSINIYSGVDNTSTRPAISATTLTNGEIRAYSSLGNGWDDGFIRISAGGGTNATAKSYIDITGYSTVDDMNKTVVIGTAGVERMRVNNLGNIGIGTSSPLNTPNYINLTIGDNAANKTGLLKLRSTYNNGDGAELYQSPTGTTFFNVASNLSGYIIDNQGNMGIGSAINTLSPLSAKLHINNIGTGNSFLVEDDTNPDGTPFVIDSTGNVGMGTLTPQNVLHVKANPTSTGTATIRVESDASTANSSISYYSGGVHRWEVGTGISLGAPYEIYDRVGGQTRFSITTSGAAVFPNGNVGIGITPSSSYKLDVAGNTNISATSGAEGLKVNIISAGSSGATAGISSNASGAVTNYAGEFTASGVHNTNVGLIIAVSNATVNNIGLQVNAGTGGTNRHALALEDGSEGIGKFLKNVAANGRAKWANIAVGDVSGAQAALSLTTNGTSGAATLTGNTLNIPNYSSSTPTLSQVLAAGNTTGANNIVMGANQNIGFDADTRIAFNTGFISLAALSAGNTANIEIESGWLSLDSSTSTVSTNITSRALALKANQFSVADSFTSTSTDIKQSADYITVTNANTSTPGIQYAADYSANFTARTLVDKAYVDGFQPALSGTGFVKIAGSTISYDNSTYAKVGTYIDGYVPRWNAVTNTLQQSSIQDDGLSVSIGTTLDSLSRLHINTGKSIGIKSLTTSASNVVDTYGGYFKASGIGVTDRIAVYGEAVGSNNGYNIGGKFVSTNNASANGFTTGVWAEATSNVAGTDVIGIYVNTLGSTANKYSLQLRDGTETLGGGKFLKDTGNGKANWSTLTVADTGLSITTSGTSGPATLAGNILNIPQYSGGGGSGTVTSVAALTLGTTGTDVSSSVATGTTTPVITLNIPTASATARGLLSAAHWTAFNNKANLASPAFTGYPTTSSPPSLSDSSSIIPNTAWITAKGYSRWFGIYNASTNTFTSPTGSAIPTTFRYGDFFTVSVAGVGHINYGGSYYNVGDVWSYGRLGEDDLFLLATSIQTGTLSDYSSTTGTISTTDSVVSAISKLNGNIAYNYGLTYALSTQNVLL